MSVNNLNGSFYTLPENLLAYMASYLTRCEAAYFKRTCLICWKAFFHSELHLTKYELHLTGKAAKPANFEIITAIFAKMIREGRCPKERLTALKISQSPTLNPFKHRFSSQSMRHIVHLPLTRLEFANSTIIQFDEGCFQHFALISSLTELLLPTHPMVDNNRPFAKTIAHLAQMKLRHLRISNIDLKDENFALFTAMPLEKLEILNTTSYELTSLCLDHLEKLPLKELTIQAKNNKDRIHEEAEYHCKDAPTRKITSLKKINGLEIPTPSIVLDFRPVRSFGNKNITEWVLTFLSLRDALFFRRTCKSFASLSVRGQVLKFTHKNSSLLYHYPYDLNEHIDKALKRNILYSAIHLSHQNPEYTCLEVALDRLRYFPLKTLTIGEPFDCSYKGYQYLSKLDKLNDLTLSSVNLSEADDKLKHLASLKELHTLNISSTNITDKDLAFLTLIPSLRRLTLGNTQDLTRKCFNTFQQMPNLEYLTITNANQFEIPNIEPFLPLDVLTEEFTAFVRQKLPGLKQFNDLAFLPAIAQNDLVDHPLEEQRDPVAIPPLDAPPPPLQDTLVDHSVEEQPVSAPTTTQSLPSTSSASLPPIMQIARVDYPADPTTSAIGEPLTNMDQMHSSSNQTIEANPPPDSTSFFSYVRSFFHAIYVYFASLVTALWRICFS